MKQLQIPSLIRNSRPLLGLLGLVLALAACGTQAPPEAQEPDLDPLALNYTNTSQGNTISYHDGSNNRIYTFLRGADGHLHVNYWDGARWNWADQGTPAGAGVAPSGVDVSRDPKAITYVDSAGRQRIYVFVRGRDNHLYVNYWDGFRWRWAHQGTPAGTTMLGEPEVLTYRQGGQQRIYVFVKGANNHLYVNYWDGARWNWAHQGLPQGVSAIAPMKTVTYRDSNRRQRIYTFANAGGNLYVNYWDGFQWRWANQGRPQGSPYLIETMGAATILDRSSGQREIYAFARGSNGRVYLNHWDGARWNWHDLATPGGITLSGSIEIATTARGRPFQAFVRGTNGVLYSLQETARGWRWRYRGFPAAGRQVASVLGTTTYVDGGRRIYTFVQADDGSLHVNYLYGGQWRWASQGSR